MTIARVLGLILILAVPPALAEKAVPRDGGSDSGSSRSEGSHPSSGSSSSGSSSSGSSDSSSATWSGSGSSSSGSSSSGSRSGSSSSSSSDRAVPRSSGGGSSRESGSSTVRSNDRSSGRDRDSGSSGRSSSRDDRSEAERRHPRPGPHGSGYQGSGGHGGRYYDSRGGYNSYGYGRVQYGHYGPHYHGGLYLTHSCYIYDDYYYGYPRYVYHYNDADPVGAVRVLVDPSETKVYVDGYYAGVVDDFDGIFQRLYLPPGRHDLTLKLDGFKSHRVRIYSAPGHTIKLHHDMVRGQGEDIEDLSGPGGDRDDLVTDRERDEAEARAGGESGRAGLGTVRLDVRPRDASVYVDGEFWGTGIRDDVKLPAGKHEISIVRPGFQNYERVIEVHPDATVDVEVELRKS
jgi:hypothetical protein